MWAKSWVGHNAGNIVGHNVGTSWVGHNVGHIVGHNVGHNIGQNDALPY